MKVDLKFGITREQYLAMEPTLTRPLSLGGIKRRPRNDGDLHGFQIKDIQKKPSSHAANAAKSRAKHAA